MSTAILNEAKAEAAFSSQAPIFDEFYAENKIIDYKRQRVRSHFLSRLNPGSHIIELNSGTGEDAIFFAENGFKVHATDISTGMQKQLREKAQSLINTGLISTELCSFTKLDELQQRGPYDAIFSNFGGLNCTKDLDKVLASFDDLLKPGGTATLVIISKFSLWESLMLFKGKFKTATRRWFASKGYPAHIEGNWFTCWYYKPSYLIKRMEAKYRLTGLEGLCTIVPPSYIEHFADKFPALYIKLIKLENRFKSSWPWKYWGDYFIISFQKQ